MGNCTITIHLRSGGLTVSAPAPSRSASCARFIKQAAVGSDGVTKIDIRLKCQLSLQKAGF